jgi:hypothetical protein
MSEVGSHRKFLVIVRAGDKSLHRKWVDGGARNWDLVVSWYGEDDYTPIADERVLVAKGWKWDVLADQFSAHPELIDDYDRIFIPDDDIETDAAQISRLFEITMARGLAVSQPALTEDSYFSHLHTLVCRSFELRHTDFVEVMAPCLTPKTLRQVLPLIVASPSGFGLDWVWARLEADNFETAAIIDATPMRHTRPVGNYLLGRMNKAGRDPNADGKALVARFGLEWKQRGFRCYGGIDLKGRRRGRWSTAWHMFLDLKFAPRQWVQGGRPRSLYHMFRKVLRPASLSQLHDLTESSGFATKSAVLQSRQGGAGHRP